MVVEFNVDAEVDLCIGDYLLRGHGRGRDRRRCTPMKAVDSHRRNWVRRPTAHVNRILGRLLIKATLARSGCRPVRLLGPPSHSNVLTAGRRVNEAGERGAGDYRSAPPRSPLRSGGLMT